MSIPSPMNSINGSLDLRNLTTPTPGDSTSHDTICCHGYNVVGINTRNDGNHGYTHLFGLDLSECYHSAIQCVQHLTPWNL